jgi:hypothetical protein
MIIAKVEPPVTTKMFYSSESDTKSQGTAKRDT